MNCRRYKGWWRRTILLKVCVTITCISVIILLTYENDIPLQQKTQTAHQNHDKFQQFESEMQHRRQNEINGIISADEKDPEYLKYIQEVIQLMQYQKLSLNSQEQLTPFNHNSRTGKPPKKSTSIEADMKSRQQNVRNVCSSYGLGRNVTASLLTKPPPKHPPTPNYDVFYIDRRDKLAWCPIYKAASTSWLHNFCFLAGMSKESLMESKQQISEVTRKLWPQLQYEEAQTALEQATKFIIVRHPFERLVSAYRDKLENINIGKDHGTEHFYLKYGRHITKKYRTPETLKRRYSQDMDDHSVPVTQGIEPTFEEFVKYLIMTDLASYADDHWMPYYLTCTPCLVDYDVIIKFETFVRDQNYLVLRGKLDDKIQVIWKHLTKGKRTSLVIRKYFASISKSDLLKLYEKYRLDFELFGYTIQEYLHYVREN